jgi:hypothetical protein
VNNIVVVAFTEPSKAYQGLSTVKELNVSGRIALNSAAVVERKANGDPVVHDNTDAMNLFGDPNGMVGRLIDGLMGTDELAPIAARIAPGTTGLMVEVYEYAVEVMDGAMGQLGGTVYREPTDDVKAELRTAEDDRKAATKQEKQEEREAHKRERETERAQKHNERVDRLAGRLGHAEQWLEGRKDPVPTPPAASSASTAQK